MAKPQPKENDYSIEDLNISEGGAATTNDPVVHWFTKEGCKRGKRNLMWDICMELSQEFESIHAERRKLKTEADV